MFAATERIEDKHELDFLLRIDPVLLDEANLAGMQVRPDDLDGLQAILLPERDHDIHETITAVSVSDLTDGPVSFGPEEEEADRLILGCQLEGGGNELDGLNTEDWIKKFSQGNIVANDSFAASWPVYQDGKSFEETIGRFVEQGNSRNPAHPMVHRCDITAGCDYSSLYRKAVTKHGKVCTKRLVEATTEPGSSVDIVNCTVEGCSFTTKGGQRALRQNANDVHNWEARACEDGCEPDKVYTTSHTYKDHRRTKHSGRWPSRCLVPNCSSAKLFNSQRALSTHLAKEHDFIDKTSQSEYFPPLQARKQWVTQTCILEACGNTTLMERPTRMVKHLTSSHSLSREEADTMISQKARTEMKVPTFRTCAISAKGTFKRALHGREEGDSDRECKRRSKKTRADNLSNGHCGNKSLRRRELQQTAA